MGHTPLIEDKNLARCEMMAPAGFLLHPSIQIFSEDDFRKTWSKSNAATNGSTEMNFLI